MIGRMQSEPDAQLNRWDRGGWQRDALDQDGAEEEGALARFPRAEMERLYQRIVLGRGAVRGGVVVQVTSPQPRVGVTSVVLGLGRAAVDHSHRRVLLCDGSTGGDLLRENRVIWRRGIGELTDSKNLLGPGLVACALHGEDGGGLGASLQALPQLRSVFDLVLLDVPAVESSSAGLVLAGHVDTTVVVVEAERTRLPMAGELAGRIRQAGGDVAGIVINKRRKNIPEGVY